MRISASLSHVSLSAYCDKLLIVIGMVNASAVYSEASQHTRYQHDSQCPASHEVSHHELGYTVSRGMKSKYWCRLQGSLLWTPLQQSHLFAAWSLTVGATMWAGGWCVDRTSAKMCLLIALIGYALISIISPFLVDAGYTMFLISRLALGTLEVSVWLAAVLVVITQSFSR